MSSMDVMTASIGERVIASWACGLVRDTGRVPSGANLACGLSATRHRYKIETASDTWTITDICLSRDDGSDFLAISGDMDQ